MDHDESRQLIQDQIERWVRKRATEYIGPAKIVLRRRVLGCTGETLETINLNIPPDDNVDPADVVEGYIYVFVEAAQRDANARKAGMQFYTLYPKYDKYPELNHGRRKNFHAVPEEAAPAEPEAEPATVGAP